MAQTCWQDVVDFETEGQSKIVTETEMKKKRNNEEKQRKKKKTQLQKKKSK